MSRQVRARRARGRSRVGERFEAEVGPVAHGGHCVVRVPDTDASGQVRQRVVFTRHALPGERVVVQVTEGTDGDRFWRGDAVQVLVPSPHRVPAPCPVAGPGLCGGCDFQHVELTQQRELKAQVVREQLVRIAGRAEDDPLVRDLVVEAVPGDVSGLRWRTRTRFVELPSGGRGMRKHRSHEVVEVADCLIATDEPPARRVRGHDFTVADDGFWQVHPGAAPVLVDAVLGMLDPRAGESVLDLYAGVGLFARCLADEVRHDPADEVRHDPADEVVDPPSVTAVEVDRAAVAHARHNLADVRGAVVTQGPVDRVLADQHRGPFDLVVLDPPREGARRAVIEAVVQRSPRAVAHVACDPAALARDVGLFAECGYELRELRAFDLFPMTHHVECVALLEPSVGAPGITP